MRLLLTSRGLYNKKIRNFFISILPKKPKECSMLLIAYTKTGQEKIWLGYAKDEILKIGIKNITLFNLKDKKFTDTRKKFDVIYMMGGGTFEILERLRKTGIDKFVKKMVLKNDVLYYGISAGSIVAGPNIESAGWGDEADDNDVNLKNLTGLELTNIVVFPHYEDKMKKEIAEFQKKVDYKIIPIKDSEAVFVDGKKVRKI